MPLAPTSSRSTRTGWIRSSCRSVHLRAHRSSGTGEVNDPGAGRVHQRRAAGPGPGAAVAGRRHRARRRAAACGRTRHAERGTPVKRARAASCLAARDLEKDPFVRVHRRFDEGLRRDVVGLRRFSARRAPVGVHARRRASGRPRRTREGGGRGRRTRPQSAALVSGLRPPVSDGQCAETAGRRAPAGTCSTHCGITARGTHTLRAMGFDWPPSTRRRRAHRPTARARRPGRRRGRGSR